MRVDKIIYQGKTKSRIVFEDGFSFTLYNGELKKWDVAEGKDILEERYRKEILPVLVSRAKERLVYSLKSSDKPETELKRKLSECYYPDEAINQAIAWAKEKHYVDDERYIENYIRYRSGGKSRKQIQFNLIQKGLPKDLIQRKLEDFVVDEEAQIEAELKRKHYSSDMDEKEKQKIIASLARKGYSWSTISHILGTVD